MSLSSGLSNATAYQLLAPGAINLTADAEAYWATHGE
jgi:hypothetical protein